MASRSTSLLIEQTTFGNAFNGAFQASPEVLGAIYADHYRHVLQVCRRFFRQREDAEDVASEVFLKLHRVLDQKDESSPFRPWLSQVAGRHCIDKLRQRKRENTAYVPGNDLAEFPDRFALSPLSQVLRSEQRRQVREQLNRLPEHYKVPLILRYYKRMSYSEIARVLNSRLPVVKMIIFRAKSQLRRNLRHSQQAQVITSSSSAC
jgi:RNA polymerase sigma-70 factor (ECF subfamily)